MSRNRSPSEARRAATSQSKSALRSQSRTKSRSSPSRDFIKDPAVLVCGVRNPAKNILRRFEALRVDDDDIHGKGDVADRATDLDAFLVPVRGFRLNDEQVDIAVARHLPGCCGTEENDTVRVRHSQDAAHDFARQRVVDTHYVHHTGATVMPPLAGQGLRIAFRPTRRARGFVSPFRSTKRSILNPE